MSDRAYNRIANILMLIGIGSALLFDSGKVSHAVAGTVGILAGLAALALYFCNKSEAQEQQEEPVKVEATIIPEDAAVAKRAQSEKNAGGWIAFEADYRAIEAYRQETARLWLSYYATHHARKLRWQVIHGGLKGRWALMEAEVELSPNEVAACAVEIIRNLSVADDLSKWEYDFGPKGLRISLKRGHPVRTAVPQEELDFGELIAGAPDRWVR
jgi:hypothetical protein